ncbi:MAG: hypothetical protein ACT4O6_09800 [Reyranella sp.]
MTIATTFLDAISVAAERSPGPRTIQLPMPGHVGGFRSFANFDEWRDYWLGLRLPFGIPLNMTEGFERAQKLSLLAWVDFDLMVAAELVALTTLEHVLRDQYLGKEKCRRRAIIAEKAEQEKRQARRGEEWWIEQASFSDLLKYMWNHDELTDEQLPSVRRSGGKVKDLICGDRDPSLADMRHARAHGNPFDTGYEAGLIELIRDLIEYAYRDRIAEARAFLPNKS